MTVSSETRYRLIIEFTEADELGAFMQHVSDSLDEGQLSAGFSWGAETVETIDLTPEDDDGGS